MSYAAVNSQCAMHFPMRAHISFFLAVCVCARMVFVYALAVPKGALVVVDMVHARR